MGPRIVFLKLKRHFDQTADSPESGVESGVLSAESDKRFAALHIDPAQKSGHEFSSLDVSSTHRQGDKHTAELVTGKELRSC